MTVDTKLMSKPIIGYDKRGRPRTRRARVWTPREDALVLDAWREARRRNFERSLTGQVRRGSPYRDLAERLGRTHGAVKARASMLVRAGRAS